MLVLRDGHLGRVSRVLAAEAASAIGCHDLTAPTERDLQRLVGNTIDKTIQTDCFLKNKKNCI